MRGRATPQFGVPYRPWVDPGPPCQFLLRQSESHPSCSNPPRKAVSFRNESRPEHSLERRPATGRRGGFVSLPRCDGLIPAAEALGQGSLRQPQVHPPLADSLTQGLRRVRVTPWEFSRSAAREAEIAERQRNPARVDSWDIL